MSKTDLETYQSSNSPRGAKLKCTTEICELYGGGKEKVREREQEKEGEVSLRKKKSKEVSSRTRKQQQSINDSLVEQQNVDDRTTDTEKQKTSRNGSMKKSKRSSKHPAPEKENSPTSQKEKKTPKVQEEKTGKMYSGEVLDSAIPVTPVKQTKASKEKALSRSVKKQVKDKEKDAVNKGNKHIEHEKDDTTTQRRGKLSQSGPPPISGGSIEGERNNSTSEKKSQKESKLDRKEKEKENNNSTKKQANTKELLSASSVAPQSTKQYNLRSVTASDIEKNPTTTTAYSSNKHNSDDYQNHFNSSSSKEFISNPKTPQQEFYFDNPHSNDVRENHEVMEEFSTLRPRDKESRKTVRDPSYSASSKTINVEKLLQDDDDEALLKENKVDKRHMDPRNNDLDELVQIPIFGMMINMDDARTPTPATACASTMTTRPRKAVRNKPSQNNSNSSSNNNNTTTTTTSNNSNNTSSTNNNQGKIARIKTSGKSSSKASRKHSRIDGAKTGGGNGSINSNLLVKQSTNVPDENNTTVQQQQQQQAQNQSQPNIKHSKSQHQQRQNQQNQNLNLNMMGTEMIGSSNSSNITSSGKNHTKEPSVTTSSSLKPFVQNSSSFRRKNHSGPPSVDRVRKWKKGAGIEKEKEREYTTSAEILAAVQQQLALADLNHSSQGKHLHSRFNPAMYNLQYKLDKNNTLNSTTKGGGGGGGVNGQVNYSTQNINLNSLVANTSTNPTVRTLPGKASRVIHPNLRKMSRLNHFYANNNASIVTSTTTNSNNSGGVINIPVGGLSLPNRGGKLSSVLNKRNGASLKNNSLARRERSMKNVERVPKKIDSWNYHSHSRDVTSDSGTAIDIRKELKDLWHGGGVKEFSF